MLTRLGVCTGGATRVVPPQKGTVISRRWSRGDQDRPVSAAPTGDNLPSEKTRRRAARYVGIMRNGQAGSTGPVPGALYRTLRAATCAPSGWRQRAPVGAAGKSWNLNASERPTRQENNCVPTRHNVRHAPWGFSRASPNRWRRTSIHARFGPRPSRVRYSILETSAQGPPLPERSMACLGMARRRGHRRHHEGAS